MKEEYGKAYESYMSETMHLNLAILRHIVFSLLSQEKVAKYGVTSKCLTTAWSEDYLVRVLSA